MRPFFIASPEGSFLPEQDMDSHLPRAISSPAADDSELPNSAWSAILDLDQFASPFGHSSITLPQWDQPLGSSLPYAKSPIQQKPSSNKAARKDIDTDKPLDRISKAVFPDGNGQQEDFKAALKSARDEIKPLLRPTAWNKLSGDQRMGILNAFRTGFVAYFR